MNFSALASWFCSSSQKQNLALNHLGMYHHYPIPTRFISPEVTLLPTSPAPIQKDLLSLGLGHPISYKKSYWEISAKLWFPFSLNALDNVSRPDITSMCYNHKILIWSSPVNFILPNFILFLVYLSPFHYAFQAHFFFLLYFWLYHMACWDLNFPARYQICAPCSGSTES